MLRLLPVLLVLAALLAPATASAAQARIADPAGSRAVASCAAKAAANAPRRHIEQVVRGVGELQGCIADTSGIAHLFLAWKRPGGRIEGRICVDPPIRDGVWHCAWDTTSFEPGSYVVVMTAIDPVGNRGSAEQAYRVERAPAEPSPQPETPDPTTPEPEAPEPDPTAPTPEAPAPEPIPNSPTVSMPLAQLIDEQVAECAQLELAPGVVADRSLSVAVLDCMTPALEAGGATTLTLDEIPVPPAIRVAFADAASLAAADELLPDSIGGVGLELVLASDDAT